MLYGDDMGDVTPMKGQEENYRWASQGRKSVLNTAQRLSLPDRASVQCLVLRFLTWQRCAGAAAVCIAHLVLPSPPSA